MRKSEPKPSMTPAERVAPTAAGWSWNLTAGEIAWSPEYFRILRLDPETTVPSFVALLHLVHTGDRLLVRQAIEDASAGGRQCCYECRIVHGDQSTSLIRSFGHLIANVAGEQLYVGSMLDLTASSQTES